MIKVQMQSCETDVNHLVAINYSENYCKREIEKKYTNSYIFDTGQHCCHKQKG